MQITGFPSDTRLAPFLGLAALLHAAVILLVPIAQERPASTPVLHLAMAQPSAAPAGAAPTRPRERAQPPSPIEPIPARAAPAAGEDAAPAVPATARATETADTTGETSARVIAQVRSALARYFVYPMAARRQGWQGEVLLGFSVTREGRIDHLEVVRSSGYRLLDEAALASLARVGSVPEYSTRDGEPLQVRMPVVYRLEG